MRESYTRDLLDRVQEFKDKLQGCPRHRLKSSEVCLRDFLGMRLKVQGYGLEVSWSQVKGSEV